ncbi:MAG: hypothetical protein FWG40_12240 [Peptococcaceae bacterium]|nr:hypothetical protein [Peptococcaceae bacterium]
MGMALKVVAIFMLVALIVFGWNRMRGRKSTHGMANFLLPVAALVVIVFLSLLKVFIIYKIIILIVAILVGGLTYWHFLDRD